VSAARRSASSWPCIDFDINSVSFSASLVMDSAESFISVLDFSFSSSLFSLYSSFFSEESLSDFSFYSLSLSCFSFSASIYYSNLLADSSVFYFTPSKSDSLALFILLFEMSLTRSLSGFYDFLKSFSCSRITLFIDFMACYLCLFFFDCSSLIESERVIFEVSGLKIGADFAEDLLCSSVSSIVTSSFSSSSSSSFSSFLSVDLLYYFF